jgi:hypothetical protein
MTVATIDTRPAATLARGRGAGGPAPKRTVVAYGFWIFIRLSFYRVHGIRWHGRTWCRAGT